jgi:predicted dehydrogenase
VASHRRGIVMNGFTGPVGLNQHLVRSIVAVRQRGGVALPNGHRVVPDPVPVGCNADKVLALARQYGIERSTADLTAALKNPNDTMFFDAAMIQMHADLVSQAMEVGKHIYSQKPIADTLDKAVVVDFRN